MTEHREGQPPPHLTGLHITEEPGGLLLIGLDRPQRKNALDQELVSNLGKLLTELPQRLEIRAVVMYGTGAAFCSGADLTEIDQIDPTTLSTRIDEFHQLILGIVEAPQPVIAAIEGPAVGFGADLALCCDMRVFAEGAYLEEAFVKIGLMPDGGGSYWMDKYLGALAFEVLARATRLSASRCEELGLANHVVPTGGALDAAKTLASELIRSAPLSLRAIKRATRARDRQVLPFALSAEKQGQARLLQSSDFREGVAAFMAKRPPSFEGR